MSIFKISAERKGAYWKEGTSSRGAGGGLLFSCADSTFLGNTVIPFREKSRRLLAAVYGFIWMKTKEILKEKQWDREEKSSFLLDSLIQVKFVNFNPLMRVSEGLTISRKTAKKNYR